MKETIRKGGLFIGGGIAALAIACGGGKGTESKVQNPDTPTPKPAATETLKLSPTPLVTETPIPPTIAPEVKKEVPCVILPDQYCSQAELIDWTYQGQTYKIVGFHLPQGVPLFSPMDGSSGKANMDQKPNTGPFHGLLAGIGKPTDPSLLSFNIMGDLKFDNMLSLDVKKGDLIAYTQDTGIRNLGNYNIIVMASQKDPNSNGFTTAEDMLRTMFPQAFEKPAK